MAFYAEIYGYIALGPGKTISSDLLDEIAQSAPIFRPCFSNPKEERAKSIVSFATIARLDDGEESLWLDPFECLLRKLDFLNATVNVIFEESEGIKLYSYFTGQKIQKICSVLTVQSCEEMTLER